MLRKLRIALQVVVMTSVTLLLLGASWSLSTWLGWAAKIQFLPALMALDFGVLTCLIVLTLLLGRAYCSVICPLGIMQDMFGWLGKKQKKNRYSHSKEKRWLRYGVWVVFVICLIIGFAPVTTLLAPYSAYGRIVNTLFKPLYDLLQNGLAALESGYESYMFSNVELWMRSVTTMTVALLTLVIVGLLAWKNGRTYCNTICPVGTTLGIFSRFSLLKVRLDKEKCKNCGMCEKNCKASAIDFRTGEIDYSRCVVCGDCIDKCKFDSLHYVPTWNRESLKRTGKRGEAEEQQPHSEGRRAFLTGLAVAAGGAAMAQAKVKVDGGLAVIEDKKEPGRETKIVPAGAVSMKRMSKHCTACQLCVSNCPNNVLRPDSDLLRLMQPYMSFERGYCRPECTRCSEVCPTGAIQRITREDKTAIHIGHAVWLEENCIAMQEGVSCNSCERHCPAGAITMVEREGKDGNTVRTPVVSQWLCIGCGACENMCPSRPYPGIYVEGNEVHKAE